MACFNTLVMLEIRQQHRSTTSLSTPQWLLKKRKREQRLFGQFVITAVVLFAYDLMFNIGDECVRISTFSLSLRQIRYEAVNRFVVGLCVSIAYIATCSINGYIYCFLNSTVRGKVYDSQFSSILLKEVRCMRTLDVTSRS